MRFRFASTNVENDGSVFQTTAYSYLPLRDGREMVAYQWDPLDSRIGVAPWPHVHVGKDLPHVEMLLSDRQWLGALAAAHLPTGLVSFTELFRMLNRDFGLTYVRNQGESQNDADQAAIRSIAVASAALKQSFQWWVDD